MADNPQSAAPVRYRATLVEAGPTLNGWVLPAEVLAQAVELFRGAPCLVDHPGMLGRPSLRNLAATVEAPEWNGQAITATLRLAETPAGRLLGELFAAHLADLDEGREAAPLGLSAYLSVAWDAQAEQPTAAAIRKVWSVDAVLHPAAGGRVERVLLAASARPVGQRTGNLDPLLLSARQGPPFLPGPLLQTGEKFVYMVPVPFYAFLVRPDKCTKLKVLLHCEVRQYAPPFRTHGDAELHHLLGGLPHKVDRFSLRGSVHDTAPDIFYEPGHRPDGTAFSGAVRAYEGHDTPFRNGKGNAFHRMNGSVVNVEVFNFQHISRTPLQDRPR